MKAHDAARAQAARAAQTREEREAPRPSDTEEEELRGWLADYQHRTSRRHRPVRRRS
jgi:hypothetical protein